MERHGTVVAEAEPDASAAAHLAILACPKCHAGNPVIEGAVFRCLECGFEGKYRDGTLLVMEPSGVSYFDALHGTMAAQNAKEGVNEVFYAQQLAYLESILKPGMTIVDIGCGPTIAYRRPRDTILVGVDPSYQSIIVNRGLDVRVFGGAQALPLADGSVDVLVCFYSIHHMIGASVAETMRNVRAAFAEFKRVVKPGGKVVVFEVNPYRPFWIAQRLFWKLSRRILGSAIDFYFWSPSGMRRLGREILAAKSLETARYSASWRTTFPPAFSLQWLRMPFILYPFHVARFSWTL